MIRRFGPPAAALAGLMLLVACAALPATRTYVLDPPGGGAGDTVRHDERPQLVLLPVAVPDYLDTTDIVIRRGSREVAPLEAGRWGERLSIGVGRALVAALQAQRPDLAITAAGPLDSQPRRLLVQIDSLDTGADGRCVLAAHWQVLDGEGRGVVTRLEGRFTIPAAGGDAGDAAIVDAVARAVAALGQAIATSLPRG